MAATPERFKEAFSLHVSGVALALWRDGEQALGLTLTSVTSVSADPPLFVFSVAEGSRRLPSLRMAERLAVALPAADQADLAQRIARRGFDPADLQDMIELPVNGVPILPGARATLVARIRNRLPVGASTLFVAEVDEVRLGRDADALVYSGRRFVSLAADRLLLTSETAPR